MAAPHDPVTRPPSDSRPVFNALDWIAMVLVIIGGINWGLIGLFNFNLVATIFGPTSGASRVIYVLVGLAALYAIYTATRMTSRVRA